MLFWLATELILTNKMIVFILLAFFQIIFTQRQNKNDTYVLLFFLVYMSIKYVYIYAYKVLLSLLIIFKINKSDFFSN